MVRTPSTYEANTQTLPARSLRVALAYAPRRPTGSPGVGRTRQLAEERALRHTAEQARDDLAEMIATASYELRAPLTVLIGQAQLLQHRLESRADADIGDRRAVDVLVAQALRLSQLLSALRDGALIDRGELLVSATTLDLGALVWRVVQALQPTVPALTLRLNADTTPLWVTGDAMRLEQVLQNLIQDVVQSSHPGGEVVITIAPTGHQVRITVRGRSDGIVASVRPDLFQRFVRAQQAGASAVPELGLGLSICKAIMDLHGGSIEVERAVGSVNVCLFRCFRPGCLASMRCWAAASPSSRST